uniref:Unconventional myosin-VI-like n=1 Tax=Petromyzon marinus TaxID=7757 RepID=A0AAJ7SKV4_PETMA|nr:unconventional myosin-VI-like [Petromyzon marinus]
MSMEEMAKEMTEILARGSGYGLPHPAGDQPQKHDLRSWKYAELRDTINTSCDLPLLESCRSELHRRLRTFHAWRARNRARGGGGGAHDPPRAPQSVMENVERLSRLRHHQEQGLESMNRVQSYFRIPFVVKGSALGPSSGGAAQGGGTPRGWWLAHYDGSWLARQLELHPGKQPVLLVAGQDDERMCELRLEETGLLRRRGAQILARRFEETWELSGGAAYLRWAVLAGRARPTAATARVQLLAGPSGAP